MPKLYLYKKQKQSISKHEDCWDRGWATTIHKKCSFYLALSKFQKCYIATTNTNMDRL